jgi:hypothetical protein
MTGSGIDLYRGLRRSMLTAVHAQRGRFGADPDEDFRHEGQLVERDERGGRGVGILG